MTLPAVHVSDIFPFAVVIIVTIMGCLWVAVQLVKVAGVILLNWIFRAYIKDSE